MQQSAQDEELRAATSAVPWAGLLELLRLYPYAPALRQAVCQQLASPDVARGLCRSLRAQCGFHHNQWRSIVECGGIVVGGTSVAVLSGFGGAHGTTQDHARVLAAAGIAESRRPTDNDGWTSGSGKNRKRRPRPQCGQEAGAVVPARPCGPSDIDVLCIAPPKHRTKSAHVEFHQQWARLRPVLGTRVEIDQYDCANSTASLEVEFPGGGAHSTLLAMIQDNAPYAWEYRYGALGSDHVMYESQRARIVRSVHHIKADERRPAQSGLLPVQIIELVANAATQAVRLAKAAGYLPPQAGDTDVGWAARATFDFPLTALVVAGRAADEERDCDLAAEDWPLALEWAGGAEVVLDDILRRRLVYKRAADDQSEPLWQDEGLAASRWTATERLSKWRERGWTVVPSRWAWLCELRARCRSWLVLPKLTNRKKRLRYVRTVDSGESDADYCSEVLLDRFLVDIVDGAVDYTDAGAYLTAPASPELKAVLGMCRAITASGRTKRWLVRQLLEAADLAAVAGVCLREV